MSSPIPAQRTRKRKAGASMPTLAASHELLKIAAESANEPRAEQESTSIVEPCLLAGQAKKKRAVSKKDGGPAVATPAVATVKEEAVPTGPSQRTRSKRCSLADVPPCPAQPLNAADPTDPPKKDRATSKRGRISNAAPKAEPAQGEHLPAASAVGMKRHTSTGATRAMEEELWKQGYTSVVGIDEAGRGPLAGPVVAAACCLPPGVTIPGVADSKQLDEAQREALYEMITSIPGVVWATASMDHTTIDRVNILQATMMAMAQAARGLPAGQCDYLLVDGNRLPKDLPAPAKAVVQGDARVFCIAAASIIAKVTRDRIMLKYHEQYPQYNFAKHKGYAVPAHYTALEKHGVSDIHRKSFQPVRGMTGWTRTAQLEQEEREAQLKQEANKEQPQQEGAQS